jgi:hypothetical protein
MSAISLGPFSKSQSGERTMSTTSSEDGKEKKKKPTLSQRIEKSDTTKSYVLDLKIHTPSSLIGHSGIQGVDAAPAMVRLALVKGLDVIAVTDLFSGQFIDKMIAAAQQTTLTVIPGVEIRCIVGDCRDITMTCLFPETFTTRDVEQFLRKLGVPKSAAGDERYLINQSFETILEDVDSVEGVIFPSRIDKTPHRFATIPILVEEYGFRAFDIAFTESASFFEKEWPQLDFAIFSFSNATALAQVGTRIAKVRMSSPGYAGVREIVRRETVVATSVS